MSTQNAIAETNTQLQAAPSLVQDLFGEQAGDSVQVFHPQQAEVLEAFGQTVRVLLSGATTDNRVSVMEVDVPAQEGPPPHIHHDEDETFLVKQGRFEFWLNGETTEVGEGDIVYGPRDVPHTFRNIGEENALLQVFAISAGFESFFRGCAHIWGSENVMPQVMQIAQAHNLEFVDPSTTPRVAVPANGKTPRIVRKGEGEALATPNGSGLVAVSESDTAGDFALGWMNIAPLGGPTYHVHHCEDEIFVVQGGSFEYSTTGRRLRAEAGDVVWLPRDVPHAFRCVSAEGGQLLGILAPGGFVNYFRESAQLFANGQLTEARIDALNTGYGIEYLPPSS
ncbi:MAG TPA: cupin domain-containing protein [Abditibacteriaceae bacterium]|jgi:quercetin dioxygenase-like cupin family protein|nr:cupin domain-containing protein [Abditibacteriaceae bacterium]